MDFAIFNFIILMMAFFAFLFRSLKQPIYEYQVIEIPVFAKKEVREGTLNSMAKNGWRLVSESTEAYTFERKKR